MKDKHVTVMGIVFINVSAMIGVRWFATAAVYGAGSIFLWIIAAFLFFIPLSLICAELASMFPKTEGGMIGWIGEILGEKSAYYASWLYYISFYFYYPSVLAFVGIALAKSFGYDVASNKSYIIIFVLVSYWVSTLICLWGTSGISKLAQYGGFFGRILPTIVLIILGVVSVLVLKIHVPTSFAPENWMPVFNSNNILFLSTLMLAMAGVEVSSPFASSMKNPAKEYPKAILLSAIIIAMVYVIGTFALLLIQSPSEINVASGVLDVIMAESARCHILWFGKLICFFISLSLIIGVIIIIYANIKMFVEGNSKVLPAFLQKKNKLGVQYKTLVIQGIVITIFVFLANSMPTVEMFYAVLVMMSTILMFIPYIILIFAYIKIKFLRHKEANSGFKLPGGRLFPLIASIISTIAVIATIVIPIAFPPHNSSIFYYELQVVGGPILFIIIGIILYKLCRKKNNSKTN